MVPCVGWQGHSTVEDDAPYVAAEDHAIQLTMATSPALVLRLTPTAKVKESPSKSTMHTCRTLGRHLTATATKLMNKANSSCQEV